MSRYDDYDEFDGYTGRTEFTDSAGYTHDSAFDDYDYSEDVMSTPEGYNPDLDSAFIQNPLGGTRGVNRVENSAQPRHRNPEYDMRGRNIESESDMRRRKAASEPDMRGRKAVSETDMRRRKAVPEPYVPRKRAYDPDQLISDEDFENTYEEAYDEYYDEDSERGGRYSDDYDDDYEELDRREMEEARERKSREKEERNAKRQDKKERAREDARIRAEIRDENERREKIRKQEEKRMKRKKHPVRRFFFRLFIIILILFIILGAVVVNITRRFNHIDTEVSKRADSMTHSVVNILLIGQDAREGQENQRSDTMILMSINQKKNVVSMTSIMRDTYVTIPGYGGNRINAAYALGGIDLLDQTIEENFNVRIDGNAMVDFEGFLEAMTALGELDIELTAEEAQYMNENPGLGSNNDISDEEWDLTEGVNTLTPSQILCYSRMRYVGNSDWDRTQRQRNVISAAISRIKHGHLLSGYKLATTAAPSITTDMKTMGMLRVGMGIITGGNMNSYRIPADGTYYGDTINGMSVLVPDIEANKNLLEQYISGEYQEEDSSEE